MKLRHTIAQLGIIYLSISHVAYSATLSSSTETRLDKAIIIEDFEKGFNGWFSDPGDSQIHKITIVSSDRKPRKESCLQWETYNKSPNTYFMIMKNSLKDISSAWSGADRVQFLLKGDGSDGSIRMVFFENDGSRWYANVSIASSKWKLVEIPLSDFKYEQGGEGRANSHLRIENADSIGLVMFPEFVYGYSHRIQIDNIRVVKKQSAPVKTPTDNLEVAIHPAGTHRDGNTFMIQDEITSLSFFFWNYTGHSPLKLILTMPREVKLINACVGMEFASHCLNTKITSTSDEKGEREWTIPLTDELLERKALDKFQWALRVFLTSTGNFNQERSIPMKWRVVDDGEVLKEGMLTLHFLKPLPTPIKTRMKFYLYENSLFNTPDEDIRTRLWSMFTRAGIDGSVSYTSPEVTQWLANKKWDLYAQRNWWGNWGVDVADIPEKREDLLIVKKDGTKSSNSTSICQTYLIEHSRDEDGYFQAAKRHIQESILPGIKFKGIVNDYEMVWDDEISPMNSCFCNRCIKAFANYANLDSSKLTHEMILEKYHDQWIVFREKQNGRMMEIFNRVIKSVDPDLTSQICSMPIIGNPAQYPIDITLYDSMVDGHWPQCYASKLRFYEDVDNTTKQLKSAVWPTLMTADPVGEPNRVPGGQDFRMNILAAASSGVEGITFFPGSMTMDGELLTELVQARKIIAELESFYLDGKRVDMQGNITGISERTTHQNILGKPVVFHYPDWSRWLRFKVHKSGDRYLISLFNYNPDKKCFVKIKMTSLDKPAYYIYDPIEKCQLMNDKNSEWSGDELQQNGFMYQIPPLSTGYIVLQPEPFSATMERRIIQDDLKKDFKNSASKQLVTSSPKNRVDAGKITKAPEIDGRLEEDCWKAASWKKGFVTPDGKPASEQTEVAIVHNQDAIFLAFKCYDKNIIYKDRKRDESVWMDDCVEIFLSTDSNRYYHFVVNAAGVIYDAVEMDGAWNGIWTAKASIDKSNGLFTIEIAIPIRNFSFKTVPLINLCRENYPTGEMSSVFKTGSSFHSVESLNVLDLEPLTK